MVHYVFEDQVRLEGCVEDDKFDNISHVHPRGSFKSEAFGSVIDDLDMNR